MRLYFYKLFLGAKKYTDNHAAACGVSAAFQYLHAPDDLTGLETAAELSRSLRKVSESLFARIKSNATLLQRTACDYFVVLEVDFSSGTFTYYWAARHCRLDNNYGGSRLELAMCECQEVFFRDL
jgi:hypothetical protein